MDKVVSRKQVLEQKVNDLEETLAQLKQQLQREIETEQHAAIEELESYLDQVNNKYANLQGFWQVLREELSELLAGKGGKK